MAQEVGYYENNVAFSEGPFVYVNAYGYRIEVEQKGHHCPVLPDNSIYQLLDANNKSSNSKTNSKLNIEQTVNWLNEQVKKEIIILNEYGSWICPIYFNQI